MINLVLALASTLLPILENIPSEVLASAFYSLSSSLLNFAPNTLSSCGPPNILLSVLGDEMKSTKLKKKCVDKHAEDIHAQIQIARKSESDHPRTIVDFGKIISKLKEDGEKVKAKIKVLDKTKEDMIVSIEMVEANLDNLGAEVT